MPKFRLRGTWKHGIQDSYVDLKAVDLLFTFLPWALAVEALIRGWEYIRIDWEIAREGSSTLSRLAAEDFFGIQFFGTATFVAGVLMAIGLVLKRYNPIIFACLLGGASYFMLASGYLYQTFTVDSSGLRTAVTFTFIACLWGLKGFVAASKRGAQARAEEIGVGQIEDER